MSSFLLSLIFLARLMNQRVLFTEGSLLSNSPMVWTNTPRMLKENGVRRLLSKVKLRISLNERRKTASLKHYPVTRLWAGA